MKQLASTAACLLASSAIAGQDCVLDDGLAYACTTDGGTMRLEVCDMIERDAPTVSYTFGPIGGEAELRLEVDMANLEILSWNGVGRYYTEGVRFRNGHYSYEVWTSTERAPEGRTSGGVTVLLNEDVIATRQCDPGTVMADLGALFDRVEAARLSP